MFWGGGTVSQLPFSWSLIEDLLAWKTEFIRILNDEFGGKNEVRLGMSGELVPDKIYGDTAELLLFSYMKASQLI